MTKKQKKTLKRIIAAAVLTVLLALLFHFVELPWFVQLVLWLVPYLVIGHDVLRKAFMGIKNGEVFDENFLMAIATIGAYLLSIVQVIMVICLLISAVANIVFLVRMHATRRAWNELRTGGAI